MDGPLPTKATSLSSILHSICLSTILSKLYSKIASGNFYIIYIDLVSSRSLIFVTDIDSSLLMACIFHSTTPRAAGDATLSLLHFYDSIAVQLRTDMGVCCHRRLRDPGFELRCTYKSFLRKIFH